jgi:heptaprenylglyceryl phosphate synthase
MALKYAAEYDKEARAWNVVDTLTGDIVRMCGGGKRGEEQAKRSADNHNQAWLVGGIAEYDERKRLERENS